MIPNGVYEEGCGMGVLRVSESAREWFERAGGVAHVEVKVVGSG